MDDAFLVRRGQPGGDRHAVVDGLPCHEGAVAEQVAQRLPLQELADDVGLTVVRTDVVDGDDVGVIERRRGLCFLREPAQAVGIDRVVGPQDLDGDSATQPLVSGAINFAHAPTAEEIANPVGTDQCAGRQHLESARGQYSVSSAGRYRPLLLRSIGSSRGRAPATMAGEPSAKR